MESEEMDYHFDSSDTDSGEFMTLIFDFNQVISALMSPTATPRLSPLLVKTSLKSLSCYIEFKMSYWY